MTQTNEPPIFPGRFKPLGRRPKESAENAEQLKADKKQREKEYRQRIPIEGKFGQGNGAYRMNYIRAKRSDTSISWVNGVFFVMNLLVLFEWYFLALILRSNACQHIDLSGIACVEQQLAISAEFCRG